MIGHPTAVFGAPGLRSKNTGSPVSSARTLRSGDYRVLALIGDGALTGGLAYEGLNDAGASGEPLVVMAPSPSESSETVLALVK